MLSHTLRIREKPVVKAFFYKEEYEKWMYAHKFERWVIGPKIGDENGGLVLLSKDVCPWDINVDTTDVYFYDKLVENTWNPIGNGWRLEPEGGTLSIESMMHPYNPYSLHFPVDATLSM